MLKWGCAIGALMVGALPVAALAQDQATPAPVPTPATVEATQTPAPQAEPVPAQSGAQQAPAQDDAEAAGEDIVVTGQLRGAVPGDVKPEVQLGPADIRAYGASNVTELMTAPRLEPADIDRWRLLIQASGALAWIENLIAERLSHALRFLDRPDIPADSRSALTDMAMFCTERLA